MCVHLISFRILILFYCWKHALRCLFEITTSGLLDMFVAIFTFWIFLLLYRWRHTLRFRFDFRILGLGVMWVHLIAFRWFLCNSFAENTPYTFALLYLVWFWGKCMYCTAQLSTFWCFVFLGTRRELECQMCCYLLIVLFSAKYSYKITIPHKNLRPRDISSAGL